MDTPKHLRIFTFKDAWPWAVAFAASIVGFVAVLFIPTAQFSHIAINALIFIATSIMTVLHFARRWEMQKEWYEADRLILGVGIDYELLSDKHSTSLYFAPRDVVLFWKKALNLCAQSIELIEDGLVGTMIRVVEKEIDVHGLKCLGTQEGHITTVVSPDVIAETTTDTDPTLTFINVIRHELSHRVLMILGYDPGALGTKHHQMFQQHNLPW